MNLINKRITPRRFTNDHIRLSCRLKDRTALLVVRAPQHPSGHPYPDKLLLQCSQRVSHRLVLEDGVGTGAGATEDSVDLATMVIRCVYGAQPEGWARPRVPEGHFRSWYARAAEECRVRCGAPAWWHRLRRGAYHAVDHTGQSLLNTVTPLPRRAQMVDHRGDRLPHGLRRGGYPLS